MPSIFTEKDVSDADPFFFVMPPILTENDDPMEVKLSEIKSISSPDPPMDLMDEELRRSPSPAVMDHRTPKEKLCSSFQPEPTTSSNVVPFIETSCSKSELHPSEESDDDDDLIFFEGKHFHYMIPFDSFRPIVRSATPEVEDECLVLEKQMDAILGALTKPVSSANLDSMDELAFGNILEDLVLQQN
jgi:hypothetical protein